MSAADLYDRDFYAWTQQQVSLLRSQAWDQLDAANLIEEIETLGRKERQEIRNRLGILIGHLLKWHQVDRRTGSWLGTIREQRVQIKLLLEDNPSLKPYLEQVFITTYELGLALAIRETRLGETTFPEDCPYTLQQVLAEFLPGPIGEDAER